MAKHFVLIFVEYFYIMWEDGVGALLHLLEFIAGLIIAVKLFIFLLNIVLSLTDSSSFLKCYIC